MTKRIALVLIEVLVPAVLLALWWILSRASTSPYLPPLSAILKQFRHDWLFSQDGSMLLPSVERIAEGFFGGALIGIVLGVTLGSSEQLRRAFEPILEFLRGVPPPAIIPLTILVFGIRDTQKALIIGFGVVWPVLLNTIDGVRGVDASFRDMARVYGLGRLKTLRSVTFPAATPQVFAGLRISLALSLLLVVLAEMFGSHNGIGYYIIVSQNTFQIRAMWSGILLLAILSYGVNILFVLVERRVLYWHRGWRAATLGAVAPANRSRKALWMGKRPVDERRPEGNQDGR